MRCAQRTKLGTDERYDGMHICAQTNKRYTCIWASPLICRRREDITIAECAPLPNFFLLARTSAAQARSRLQCVRSTYRGYTVGTMNYSGGWLRSTLDELQNLLHVKRLDDLQKVRDKLHVVFACASLSHGKQCLTTCSCRPQQTRQPWQGKARRGKARQYRRLHLLLLAAHRHKVLGACYVWAVTSDRPQSLGRTASWG